MNPIPSEATLAVPDHHWHRCSYCATTWSHRKSAIPPGHSHRAHLCPTCSRPFYSHLVAPPLDSAAPPISYPEYYGPVQEAP